MSEQEDILNIKIDSLKKGRLLDIASDIEENDLTTVAASLYQLPRKNSPVPSKRRLYITNSAPVVSSRSTFPFLRVFSISFAGLALTLTIIGSYSILHSLPGERLFAYKRSAESVRVKFASSSSRASIELSLAQKRLAEARQVLATNSNDPKMTAAALTELTEQTKTAVATVQDSANKHSATDTELVSKLSDLTKNQFTLVSSIEQTEQTKPIALEALSATRESNKAIDSIKKIIAATNEETLAEAPITITGIITAVDKNGITVDKTVVSITSKTTIKSNDAKLEPKLALKAKVNVQGTRDQNGIIAKDIIVDMNPVVEKEVAKKNDTPAGTLPPPPPADTNPTHGSFIPEDPNPQFNP